MIWGHSRPLVLHHFSFQRPLRLFPTRGHQEKTPQSPHLTLWAVLKRDFLGEEEVESELSPTKRFGDAQHRHWLTHPTECTGECTGHPPPTCQGPCSPLSLPGWYRSASFNPPLHRGGINLGNRVDNHGWNDGSYMDQSCFITPRAVTHASP